MRRWNQGRRTIMRSPDKGSLFLERGVCGDEPLNSNIINDIEFFLEKSIEQERKVGKSNFKEDSYSGWAIKELLLYLEERKSKPILIVLDEFKEKMEMFSEINKRNRFIFFTARRITELATDWLIN